MLFLLTTTAVSGNNKHGEWCVFREALSRVSVRTGQRVGIQEGLIEREIKKRKGKKEEKDKR